MQVSVVSRTTVYKIVEGLALKMDTNSYVAFLLMGVAFVLIDGQILYRSGLGYLHKVYPADPARSVMQQIKKTIN
jgi:hypothetical protein